MVGTLSATQAWCQWDAMVSAAYGVLHDRDEATECATQAIVQVLERRPADVENAEAFMVTVAKRRAVDRIRAHARERHAMSRVVRDDLAAADVADAVCDQHEAAWVDQYARTRLEPDVYQLLGHIGEGLTVAEAAQAVGMTFKAAEGHLTRARKQLRSAALRALAILLGVLAALRRAATPAATVATAAAVVTLLALLPGTHTTTLPATTAPDVQVISVQPASPSTAQGSTAVPRARHASVRTRNVADHPAGQSVPHPTMTTVSTPAGKVDVYDRDDGYRPVGPVDRVQHCVDTLVVSVRSVGCH
ncbi:MAG: RNA polymerase sigma factor [Mycobacteriales bacterium]